MCSGEVVYNKEEDNSSSFVIKCEDNDFNKTFYICYSYGSYTPSVGDTISMGDEIGSVGDEEYIQIEMCWNYKKKKSTQIQGTLNKSDNTFTSNGQVYSLVDNLSFDKLSDWKTTTGKNSNIDSYCWIIFNQDLIIKEVSASGSSSLQVTIDNYIAKFFVGVVAIECSWNNAAVAQGVLTVCRNWIYVDCRRYKNTTQLSFLKEDVTNKNGLAEHFSQFITGSTNWSYFNSAINKGSIYFEKTVSGTDLTCLQFVKKFFSEGTHWTYIDEAVENKTATLASGVTLHDVEDCAGFPSSSSASQRVILIPPFSDWILNWGYLSAAKSYTKPSELLWG